MCPPAILVVVVQARVETPALPRKTSALPRCALAVCCASLIAACGVGQPPTRGGTGRLSGTSTTAAGPPGIGRAHPQAVEPVAGQAGSLSPRSATATSVSVGPPSTGGLAAPVSIGQVEQELRASGLSANPDQATLTPNGLAIPPVNAPPAVQEVIQAGNEIAHLPYRWGGGHATYEDTAYDCSGSISFVFEAAHLLKSSVVSGDLMSYGDPGPGKWITVFANPGHTFMYVAGLRFDTVALAETGSRWSDRSADESNLSSFAIRHPPGF